MLCLWKVPYRKLKSCAYSKSPNSHGTEGKSSIGAWLCQKHWKKIEIRDRMVAPQAFHSMAFQDSDITAVISKCSLKNTILVYLSKPMFLPCAMALPCSDSLASSFKWILCLQICSFVQKALFRNPLLSFLLSLQPSGLWSLAQCFWAQQHLPQPCPPGVSIQYYTWESLRNMQWMLPKTNTDQISWPGISVSIFLK